MQPSPVLRPYLLKLLQLSWESQSIVGDHAPIVINEKNFSYDTFMHMDHDNNVSCDGYIVDFINDATESYYERGKHGYMHLNNMKFPIFMLKLLKFHL